MLRMYRAAQRHFFAWLTDMRTREPKRGRITIVVLVSVFGITALALFAYFQVRVPEARADNVTTSLTVLNTPPNWTIDAQEATQSSTSTPTNQGTTLSFVATATDSSNDNYWLIICSVGGGATPHNNAPPTCTSGTQWAISATTTSATQATASTSTSGTLFNNESNAWYAYVCDGNSTGAQCNATVKQGTGSTASPFVINHAPSFSAISNNGPKNPGQSVTWSATASDSDTIRGGDTVQLFVCKANDFVAASSSCGAGGTWATSTAVSSNPTATFSVPIPTQDKSYNAYVYIMDQSLLVATSTFEASNSTYSVNNVAPTISAATISLVDRSGSGDLRLVNPATTTLGYKVQFTVTDNNSCQNSSGGQEIVTATSSVYRSGVTQNSCKVSTDYNTNSCYPSANPQVSMSCTQDAGSCSGPSSTNSTWTCTFPLWFNADPTDAGSLHAAENWLASAQAVDDNGAMSPFVESSTGNELDSFLAFTVSKNSIGYGGLQPGQKNDPLATTTDLIEQGNIGLDESLYGDTMCTTWSGPDSCDAISDPSRTKTITVDNQKFAASSVSYASGASLTSSTSPATLAIHVPKTTATSTLQTKNTYWGIQVPASIQTAGNYAGQNTVTAVESNSSFW
ncbi:MAG TPA: hypothetical protein VMU25_04440 [Candidatus Paceibacterota bacterium]|nr:hypothetical protein [Candidatus Paceibacterota bacterium]